MVYRSYRQEDAYDHFSLPRRQVTDCRPTVGQHFGLKHYTNCSLTVGRLLANSRLYNSRALQQNTAQSRLLYLLTVHHYWLCIWCCGYSLNILSCQSLPYWEAVIVRDFYPIYACSNVRNFHFIENISNKNVAMQLCIAHLGQLVIFSHFL